MLIRFLNALLGCAHTNTTFPQTKDEHTHVTCLQCGAEFEYDWSEMRMRKTKPTETRRPEQSAGTGGACAVAGKGAAGDLVASSN